MVSVLDLIIPSLLRERYLFRCSSMTIIMWPFWFVAVLDVIPISSTSFLLGSIPETVYGLSVNIL